MDVPNLIPKESFNEVVQWNADTGRLLKIALRNHDPESLAAVQQRIADKYSIFIAEKCTFDMINHLMMTEGWDWQLPDGSPSPLI